MALVEETAGVGDVGELYGQLAGRVERMVRLDVRAPDVVIEDACQFAWTRLVRHHDRVHRETVMTWLVRTAVHEAFRLLRRERRHVPLEAVLERASPASLQEFVERRERLAVIAGLPERQQRVLWLRALGLSYVEIGQHESCTIKTVDRQLLRARRRIRDVSEETGNSPR